MKRSGVRVSKGVVLLTAAGSLWIAPAFVGCGTNIGGVVGGVNLPSERARSFFTAFQVDPVEEDTAGPKFIVAADVDQDGLTDLVTAWNESQTVQLHLQRRTATDAVTFETVNLGGTSPIAIVAGVQLGQINDDNGDGMIDDNDWLDVVVLSKATGAAGFCPGSPPSEISALEGEIIVLFSPGSDAMVVDGDAWGEMILVNPFVRDRWIHNQFPGNEAKSVNDSKTAPEWSGFTSLVVGNMDGQPGDEIVVALNPASCDRLGQEPPVNTVDLWINPGSGLAEDSSAWGTPALDENLSRGVPVALMLDAPQVKDLALMDVDGDGDLDVIATWTDALSANLRWARNPLMENGVAAVTDGFSGPGVATCAGGVNDEGPCPNGDADCLGVPDGTCIGGSCDGGSTPGASCTDNSGCTGVEDGECIPGTWRFVATQWEERPVGQVDSGADVIALGDIDGDGADDVVVRSAAARIVQWFRHPCSPREANAEPQFPPNDCPTPDRFNFPWPVFTLTEITTGEPQGVGLGDLTGDGSNEVVVASGGGVFWYDVARNRPLFDPWSPTTIVDAVADTSATPDAGEVVPGLGVGAEAVDTTTHINALLIVDLDGDGRNDVVATLDRRSGAGLSDDRLVWYRSTR